MAFYSELVGQRFDDVIVTRGTFSRVTFRNPYAEFELAGPHVRILGNPGDLHDGIEDAYADATVNRNWLGRVVNVETNVVITTPHGVVQFIFDGTEEARLTRF